MALPIQALQIDGWGRVGTPVAITGISDLGGGAIATDAAGVSADWIGAEFEFIGADAYDRGSYSLVSVSASAVQLRGTPRGGWSGSGFLVLADHYRIASATPAFVTGSDAAEGWLDLLADIADPGGIDLPKFGGIAESDSLTAEVVADASNTALCEIMRLDPVPMVDALGIAVTVASPFNWDASSFTLSDTPTLTGARLVWVDAEAIAVTIAGTTATVVKRGVLGTLPRAHMAGALVMDRIPSPMGARGRVVTYAADAESAYDVRDAFHGVWDGVAYADGTSRLVLTLSTDLVSAYSAPAWGGVTATAQWGQILASTLYGVDVQFGYVTVLQTDPYQRWQWFAIGEMAVRRGDLIDGDATTYDGIDAATGMASMSYLLNPRYGFENPVVLEEPDTATGYAMRGYVQRQFRNLIVFDRSDTLFIDWSQWTSSEIDPCHVFEDEGVYAFSDTYRASEGVTRCNPIRALLQVLLSTGGGYNQSLTLTDVYGDLDTLPPDIGLAIPIDRLDQTSFILARPLPAIGNLHITIGDIGDVGAWISERILEPFALALVTTRTGQLRLIDLTDLREAPVFDLMGGLASEPEEIDVRRSVEDTATALTVTFRVNRRPSEDTYYRQSAPWRTEAHAVANGLTDERGALSTFARVVGAARVVDPGWCVAVVSTHTAPALLVEQNAALLSLWRSPRLRIEDARVLSDYCDDVALGRLVTVTGLPIPGVTGARDEAATYYAIVDGFKQPMRDDVCEVSLSILGAVDPASSRWAATGLVDTVTSATEFVILPDAAETPPNPPYATDAEAFRLEDRLTAFSANLEQLSDNNPKIVGISGNTITINAGFTLGGSPVTLTGGELIILSKKNAQPAGSISARGWLDYGTTTPYTVWK